MGNHDDTSSPGPAEREPHGSTEAQHGEDDGLFDLFEVDGAAEADIGDRGAGA